MAEQLGEQTGGEICLFHCVRDESEAVGQAQLSKLAEQTDGFDYVLFTSNDGGRLDAAKLQERVEFDLNGAHMMFCGPPPLRAAIVSGLKDAGKKLASVKYELFEFR